jgi:nucleoid-associated protein YgaU
MQRAWRVAMRWWYFRRPIVAVVACASALLVGACFGGGSSPTPTPQATSISVTSTASGAAPPRLPSPSPLAALPLASPTPVRASGPDQTYTIESGDTLAKIAQKYYGDETLWRKIYDANKTAIGDSPDNIKVGTQLKIPPKE